MKTSENRGISTRRDFVKKSALAVWGAPLIISSQALGSQKRKAANDRITVACIGVGGRGTDDLKSFIREPAAQIVAVCDVFETKRIAAKTLVEERYSEGKSKGEYHGCEMFKDFRELLARKEIDAVSITTPDHWHVPIGLAAVKAGKDLFVEKPLSYTVAEGRLLCNAVKKHKRIFQHGTQQRTDRRFLLACELVRNKRIGELKTIHVVSPAGGELENQPEMPVPKDLDYPFWLGSAPFKPYTEKRCQTPWWWYISDYTIGFVAGWGVHHIDIAQWGMNTDATGPIEIAGTGAFPKGGMCDTATTWDILLTYANGVRVKFTGNQEGNESVRFEGTEGWVQVSRSSIEAGSPLILEAKFGPKDIRLYDAPTLQQNFLECIRSRKETLCPVETAHRSTTICHLSQIALLLKRKLVWNPKKEECKDDAEANAMLKVRDLSKAAFQYDYYSV